MIETIKDNRTQQLAKWKILDATTIKMIAVLLMVFDHIHQMYAWNNAPLWLTIVGRPVFPMFLFIAAESFHYTSNRKKYLKRLLFSSWGMTFITTALSLLVPNPNIVLMNNAFSTFFITGLYMQFWDWFVDGIKRRKVALIIKSILCCFIPLLCAIPMLLVGALSANENIPFVVIRALAMLAMLIPNILTVEGGFLLVILGTLFYIFRKNRILQIIVLLLLSGVVYIVNHGGIQWLMCGATIPMFLYNGQRGRGIKNFFYVFYPAHICLLYLIATFL